MSGRQQQRAAVARLALARLAERIIDQLDAASGDAELEPDDDDEDSGGEELHRSCDRAPGDAEDAEWNGDEHEWNNDEHEPGELWEI